MSALTQLRSQDLAKTAAGKAAAFIHGSEAAGKIAERIKDPVALEKALIGKLESQRDFAAEYKT